MNFLSSLSSIPPFRPAYNCGSMLDIPTGTYHFGEYGQSILSGGMPHILSVVGPGNAGKTSIIYHIALVATDRITPMGTSIYDSEVSSNYDRVNTFCKRLPNLSKIDHSDQYSDIENIKVKITSSAEELGDVYFDKILEIAEAKKDKKITKLTTPFFTPEHKPILVIPPTISVIDSLSELKVTNNEESIVDKNSIGDSGMNILWMRQGGAKKQLITQLPNMAANASMHFLMTAHVGDEFEMGMMAPKKHKLMFAKKGSKVTGTTKAFEFINNALYEIFNANMLNNKDYGTGVLYPAIESDRLPDCTDLTIVTLKLTRNKGGPSGAVVDLILSQREGVLPHLSMFHYIKESGRFGFEGNNTSYSLSLLPDVKIQRTTVRNIIDSNAFLQRALEITSEMLQIKELWATLPDDLMCTPQELYTDLKSLGYDWSILLNTRSWWTFKEYEQFELPQLTTLDLLSMRKGLYHPYWLNDDKVTYKKEFKHKLNS